MAKVKRSIGRLETYEAPDKAFNKHLLTEGVGDVKPNPGSTCTIHMTLVGGGELDASQLGGYKIGEECEVVIGEGDSIFSEHFDQILCSMKDKETSYVKSRMDSNGTFFEEITKEHGLKLNVTVMSLERAADASELQPDEVIEHAQHQKDKGTELFQKGNLAFAMKRYQLGIVYVEQILESSQGTWEELRKQAKLLLCQCHFNLGACFLKEEKYESVIEHCDKGLDADPRNVKGLFRRGQAYTHLHKYDLARADLKRGLEVDPDNKAIKNQLRTVDDLVKKEKDLYKRMF